MLALVSFPLLFRFRALFAGPGFSFFCLACCLFPSLLFWTSFIISSFCCACFALRSFSLPLSHSFSCFLVFVLRLCSLFLFLISFVIVFFALTPLSVSRSLCLRIFIMSSSPAVVKSRFDRPIQLLALRVPVQQLKTFVKAFSKFVVLFLLSSFWFRPLLVRAFFLPRFTLNQPRVHNVIPDPDPFLSSLSVHWKGEQQQPQLQSPREDQPKREEQMEEETGAETGNTAEEVSLKDLQQQEGASRKKGNSNKHQKKMKKEKNESSTRPLTKLLLLNETVKDGPLSCCQ